MTRITCVLCVPHKVFWLLWLPLKLRTWPFVVAAECSCIMYHQFMLSFCRQQRTS